MSDVADGVPAGGGDPLTILIALQDMDTSIAQLQHRRATMPERRQLAEAEAALSAIDARATELGARRAELVARQAELEEQVGALVARRTSLEDRMYADRNSAARDLQAMDAEIHHLSERRAELEEVELAVMEEQEPVDAELAKLADERSQLATAAEGLRAAAAAADSVVAAELSTLGSARALEAARIPADLLERYEALRARLGGVGAARLVGNRCDGCHLELPSAEVERIRHLPPGTMATCDQCGRILVRVGEPRAAPGPG